MELKDSDVASGLPEPRTFLEAKTEAPVLFALAGFRGAVVSLPCPSTDRPNEDGVALIAAGPRSCVVAVADGMGGRPEGGKAVRTALGCLAAEVRAAVTEAKDLRTGILDGFETANREVSALGTGAATTLVAAELVEDTVRVYHVGDSEALVVGQRGKLKLDIVSHTPAGYGKEAGLLSEREAMSHEERHLLLNLIGSSDMRIDLGPRRRMAPRDTLVLGSDGLFDNWRSNGILERVRRGPLERAARELTRATLERMVHPPPSGPSKPDDLSFVLVRRDLSPQTPPHPAD